MKVVSVIGIVFTALLGLVGIVNQLYSRRVFTKYATLDVSNF